MSQDCPFCDIETCRITVENSVAVAIHDAFPVADGHTLVVPRQHISSIFGLSNADQAQLWQLVAQVRSALHKQLSPDAFNIGVNDGDAAGQTVLHAHVHVIPRYGGDVPDPRGGRLLKSKDRQAEVSHQR